MLGKLIKKSAVLFLFFMYMNLSCDYKNHLFDKTAICINRKYKEKNDFDFDNINKYIGIIQYQANNPIEDRFSAVALKNFPGFFLSVLDGHGGELMAEFANQRFNIYFDHFYKQFSNGDKIDDEIVTKSINYTFDRIEKEFYNEAIKLYKSGNGRLATVGSCVTIAIVSSDKIYVANLGDSKAKLYKDYDSGYQIVKLTNTHNAEKKAEQEKLLKEFPNEQDIFVCKRKNKICYVKGRLQPTRSLGDFHLKYREFNNESNNSNNQNYKKAISKFNGPYIKSTPEIKIMNIDEKDEYLVMGTDGLWDFLSSVEVGEILLDNKSKSNEDKAKIIYKKVMSKAAKERGISLDQLMKINPGPEKRRIHDDITIILFNLKH